MTLSIIKPRIVTFDILRGILLCVIAIDHMWRFPSIWEWFTGRGQLWVSAAEGFFLISGVLVGAIYGKKSQTNMYQVWFKLWRRAILIYLVSVLVTVVSTVIASGLPKEGIKPGLWSEGTLVDMLSSTLSLKYRYGWADYLPYYTVFMLVAPIVLWWLKKNCWWLVAIISLAVWSMGRNNFFSAWQLIFTFGVGVGYYQIQIKEFISRMTQNKRKTLAIILTTTTVLSVITSAVVNFAAGLSTYKTSWEPIFAKESLGAGRFGLAILWFTTLYIWIEYWQKYDKYGVSIIFSQIGKYSLFVYAIEAIVLLPINVILPIHNSFVNNSLIGLVMILFLFSLAQWRNRWAKSTLPI